MSQMEIKKMKQGMSYSCKEKTIILNVFKYFRLCYPEKCVTELVRRTAKATGCSEKSIFQFRKEESSATGFKEPSKTKVRKSININSRDIKYGPDVRQAIRNIIYDLKYNKNIIPSLSIILKQVNNNDQLPNFSVMTLRRLLFDMGFFYEKNGNKSILVDSPPQTNEPNQKIQPTKKKPNKNVTKSHMQSVCSTNNMPLSNSVPITVNNVNDQQQLKELTLLQPTNIAIHNPSQYETIKPVSMPPVQNHVTHLTTTNSSMIHNHIPTEEQRFLPMHMTQPEHHIMIGMPHNHNMPMMLNQSRDIMPAPPPISSHPMSSNMDLHIKYEFPWIHSHSQNMVKQQ